MPTQPPVFGRQATRTPWARAALGRDERKRGRAGQRDRAAVIDEEPFCRECLKAGKRVATDVVDHVIDRGDWPLGKPGWDDRANKQGLCTPCHDEKSKRERAARARRRAELLG